MLYRQNALFLGFVTHVYYKTEMILTFFHHRPLRSVIAVCCLLTMYGCGDQKAQQLVDAAIEAHGGPAFKSFFLEFDFRERHYTAARNGGIFTYTRAFMDSTGVSIKDVLDNNGLTRYRDGEVVDLSEKQRNAFTGSVNSVIYFALLPFGLNDDAVRKEWIEETTFEGQPYNVVRVTFADDGDDASHEDEYLYWFHKEKNTMDYLAYSFETDGGGLRFRKAVNPRREGGILFQDYLNYKPVDKRTPLDALQSMFEDGALVKVSEINLEHVRVGPYR